jgi:hypothetical protein
MEEEKDKANKPEGFNEELEKVLASLILDGWL